MSKTISLRVSTEEYKTLLIRAIKKDMNVSEYIKYLLFRGHDKNRLISSSEAQERG